MKRFVFLAIFAMVVIGYSNAQSTNNDSQQIVGTWTQVSTWGSIPSGTVWIFNANGTGTDSNRTFFYGICANGDINITVINGWKKLFMSPDGKRMFIDNVMFQKN